LHTAKGSHAGVDVPARVDVYGELGNGQYHYAGGVSLEKQEFQDSESHWLHVEISSPRPEIMVIVRPRGSYLFLDEVSWESRSTAISKSLNVVGDAPACERDSLERHRKSLLGAINPEARTVEAWVREFGSPEVAIWAEENPFVALQPFPPAWRIRRSKIELDLSGSRSESESGCIGILSTGESERAFDVAVNGDLAVVRWVSISHLQPILSADGQMVYDPLLPLNNGAQMKVPGRQASYIWIQADMRQIPPGRHKIVVNIKDSATSWYGSVPVAITVAPITLQPNRRPAANNWAYTSDRPIWRDREIVLSDLVEHGINVFVLHPSVIPRPSLKDEWDLKIEQRFLRDLTLYRGKGLILLYLEWGRGQGPAWIDPVRGKDSSGQKNAVRRWVRKIITIMESLNIDLSEWALYPIDEPRGEDLRFLREVAAWVKEEDSAVQIYANPISTTSVSTSSAELVPLESLVNFWQPSLSFANNQAGSFFKKLKHPWWVYAGAPGLAKSASPWEHYRLLSWRAWGSGAVGVGFWSYSDTSGTSAWDDLDGRRPDFAVVYEGRDGSPTPVSSRRWEAFREGIEDFQLLESAIYGDISLSPQLTADLRARVKKILNQTNPAFELIEGLRRELLNTSMQ
jgi:hypothetical protein